MNIDFSNARYTLENDGCWFCVRIQRPSQVTGFLAEMKDGKSYTAELKEKKSRRSLDANAYYWELGGRIAAASGEKVSDIYREHIRDIGGNYETLCIQEDAVESFKRKWERNGLGWQCQIEPSKLPGCKVVLAYYGSSVFDTAQMSRLIDHAVQDCRALGIETRPEEEIKSLLEAWG